MDARRGHALPHKLVASHQAPSKIYWDGTEVASCASMKFPPNVARSGLYVGKSHWLVKYDPMFKGQMRDLFVWDVALS